MVSGPKTLPTCNPSGRAANAPNSVTPTIPSGFTQYTTTQNNAAVSSTPSVVRRTDSTPNTKHPNTNIASRAPSTARRCRARRYGIGITPAC